MKKQFGFFAFTGVILLLCLVPSAGMLLGGGAEAGGNEALTSLPALRGPEGQWNSDYLTELSDHVEGNYFLRQHLVTAWSALNQKVFHTSITDSVLLGRDGWLYFGDTLEDYTGSNPLSAAEAASAARNLFLMSEYCESQGAQFLFTIAPNKNSLYPQWMPDLPVFSDQRNADILQKALEAEKVNYLDLFEAFRSQEEVLYFPRDSHWNSKGAALAADSLNASLGRKSSYFNGDFTPQAVHKGDLYDMLCPTGTDLDTDMVYDGALDFTYDVPILSAANLTILTSGGGESSLLMFRDSFGNLLYPYLADSFAHALFSRSTAYRLDLIPQQEADCVVVELVERNLRYLLENIPVMPAPAREPPENISPLEGAVSLTAEVSQYLPGYVLVSGSLPMETDAGASVCLYGPSGCYEAFRFLDGEFGLYIPETMWKDRSLTLVSAADGQTVSLPVSGNLS